jgi:hypothetical protein
MSAQQQKPTPAQEAAEYLLSGKRHAGYTESVKIYEALRIHIEGLYPDQLIATRRPNESEKIWKFRKDIYQPITKDTPNRVITSLGKIRRSPDWAIKYPDAPANSKIAEGELLSDYLEKNYPYHTSITNWVFKIALKSMLGDPNALAVILPSNIYAPAGEYVKPIALIFNSPNVIAYEEGRFAILKYKGFDNDKGGRENYLIVTPTSIEWTYITNKKTIVIADSYAHDLGYLPVIRLGGTFCVNHGAQTIYESYLSPMLPYLNEAAREYSDHQAEILQHIFSETWEWASQGCNTCKNELGISVGQIKNPKNVTGKSLIKCPDCSGTGISPYNKLVIRPAKTNLGEQPAPIPPKGFIEKNTEIARLQDERIEKHRYRALASINFQFLDKAPQSESGIAKEVDRDELNNFVYNVAETIVEDLDFIIKAITDYRYMDLIPNTAQRYEILPTIPVPQKFDLVNPSYLIDEYGKAKTANMSGVVLSAMEAEFVAKKFIAEPELLAVLQLTYKLDPIPSKTTDEKMSMYQNKAVTQEAYIVSSNINAFIKRALLEDRDFMSKPTGEQVATLESFAQEVIDTYENNKDLIPTPDGAPSAADLKFTVGGLTSMIEIAKAVASGLYPLNAAVALVQDRFGLTEDEARAQLGNPQIITDPNKVDNVLKLT